ncbi:MAG: hypothetical protein ACYC21_05890 [Eubacteriales bacterium]|nr:hypothetical protein [Bacillota bacterium]
METDNSWFKLAAAIADNLPTVPSLECPRCGLPKIDFQYVGDETTKKGFLCIWCTSCLHGLHISGVRIPPHADFLAKDSPEEVKKRIPNIIP